MSTPGHLGTARSGPERPSHTRATFAVAAWTASLLFDAFLLGHFLGTRSDFGFHREPIALLLRLAVAGLGLTFNLLIRRGCDPGQARIYRNTLSLLVPIWSLCWMSTWYID